jgi:hypothetical protein
MILPAEPEIPKVIPVLIYEIYFIVSGMTLFGMCLVVWLVFYNYCKPAVANFLVTLSNLPLSALYSFYDITRTLQFEF